MKRFICFIVFLCLSYFINSQVKDKYDYYLKVLDTSNNTTVKLNVLDSLTKNYKNPKNLEDFYKFSEQFIDLAIELKEFRRAIHKATFSFYNISYRLGKNDKALSLLEKTEIYASKVKDSLLIGKLYLKKGGGYYTKNEFEIAIEQYNKAINYIGKKDSIFVADAIYFKGQVYAEKKDYLKSINNLELASKYYKNLNDIDYMIRTKEMIVNIYGAAGFYKEVLKRREKIIKERIKTKQTYGLIADYYNQSQTYKKIGDTIKQEQFLLKADSLIINKIPIFLKIQIYSELAKFYSHQNLELAYIYLNKSKLLVKKIDTNYFSTQIYNFTRAYLLFNSKKYLKAEKILVFLLKDEKLPFNLKIEVEKLLSEVHHQLENPTKELFYFKEYIRKKDSVNSVEKLNTLTYYQSLFENEQQEKTIASQENYIALLAKDNTNKQRLIFFVLIGFVLLTIIASLAYKRRILEKKKNLREEFSHNLLLSQEEERKRIAKDLHDSLGQQLLLIKNNIVKQKDNTSINLINDAIEEMRNISRVLHPFRLEEIGISKALDQLVYQLNESYTDIFIFGNINTLKTKLSVQQELNIFRIVQECFSNIIKHSKAQSAEVALSEIENLIILSIKDNGIGFKFQEKYNSTNNLGLKTIKERVRFLNGTLKVNSNNKGTEIIIKI